jgi:hypothetical protein
VPLQNCFVLLEYTALEPRGGENRLAFHGRCWPRPSKQPSERACCMTEAVGTEFNVRSLTEQLLVWTVAAVFFSQSNTQLFNDMVVNVLKSAAKDAGVTSARRPVIVVPAWRT